jgi:hypothetical protein
MKENANQKLTKWMNHTYIETEKKKPFFEGYKPPYYFKNTTDKVDCDILSKSSILGLGDYEKCTSMSSKGFALDDLTKAMEQLEKLPPVPVEMEIGRIAWEVLNSKLNIHMIHDRSKISSLFGINIVLYEGDEIKFNQMRVKYNNGDSKVIDVFEYNCNYDSMYKYIFREELK